MRIDKRLTIQKLIFPSLFIAACVATVAAQSPANATANTNVAAIQQASASLANLPEADSIIYLSPRRILTEAAPRIMPANDLQNLRSGMNALKTQAGIDPQTIDYLVLQARFRKPAADLSFSLPDLLLVAHGDFDGAALIQLIREGTKGKLREESYNSKTINLLPLEDLEKEAQKMPILKSLSEIGIVLLNGDTIAVGNKPYLKAAIDASAGGTRINGDLLNSLMREPSALVSSAGSPLTAFAKMFALLGTETNPRPPKCDMKLGDYYASITMDASSFKLRGAMNADNPDTAKIIKSLLSMALDAAVANIKDSKAQSALKGLVITPTDTEVLIEADVSQQAVADFIRDASAPKKQDSATSTPATVTRPRPTRRGRRTTRKNT